jgi:hypothetical protein
MFSGLRSGDSGVHYARPLLPIQCTSTDIKTDSVIWCGAVLYEPVVCLVNIREFQISAPYPAKSGNACFFKETWAKGICARVTNAACDAQLYGHLHYFSLKIRESSQCSLGHATATSALRKWLKWRGVRCSFL